MPSARSVGPARRACSEWKVGQNPLCSWWLRFGHQVPRVEAAPGLEPGNNGFADRPLSHLGMPPRDGNVTT